MNFSEGKVNELMNEFIKKELTTVRRGEEVTMTQEEIEELKPKFFETSGTWGADVEAGAPYDFYMYGKWELLSGTTKRRIWGIGQMRPKCRNELYYGVLNLTGEIPVEFHVVFNKLVKHWKDWMYSHSCTNCGTFNPPQNTSTICVCGWED